MSNLQNTSLIAVGDFSGYTLRSPTIHDGDVPSAELEALVALGVETAIEYLSAGGLLVPLLLTETDQVTGHEMTLFGDPMSVEADLDAGLRQSRIVVDQLPPTVVRYVWIYDGYAGTGARHSDAIICEAAEQSGRHGWQLSVRYRLQRIGVTILDAAASVGSVVHVPMCSAETQSKSYAP